ncbi:hypothetical protein ZWY2020_058300 [Hordeum vulgare]|nr:hypothetical protein ZWY2020_058300 [Hordeum vulgare]
MRAVGRTRISTTTWTPSPSRRSSTPASTARRSTLKRLLALISLGFYVDHRFPQAVKIQEHAYIAAWGEGARLRSRLVLSLEKLEIL